MTVLSILNDQSSQLLSSLMEVSQQRQSVIANNLANSNTPGYIRKDVEFKDEMRRIIASGNIQKLANLTPKIVDDNTHPVRIDGNNVIIPDEMNAMMQNSVLYNLLTKAFSTRLNILKSAIKGA